MEFIFKIVGIVASLDRIQSNMLFVIKYYKHLKLSINDFLER